LRTPLAVIQGSASSLELVDLQGAPARAVQRISRTSRQMGDLLNTLLLLAREDNDSDQSNTQIIHVNELVDTMVKQLQHVYSDRNNEVHVDHLERLEVRAPESVLSIVISNVIGNAFSYTRNGRIEVVIGESNVVIRDTGSGMSRDVLEKVFEPFFRGESVSDSHHQGLGLAIVKQSCKKYGWAIDIESEEGLGTAVTIRFG